MRLVQKAAVVVADPANLRHHLGRVAAEVLLLLRRGRIGVLASALVAGVVGWSPYHAYLDVRANRGEGIVDCRVHDHVMTVDLRDRGISRDLYTYGTREHRTVELFRRELEALSETVGGTVRMIDVGANIGYFSLIATATLGESLEVVAFEPFERNLTLLRRNLERNGRAESVTVVPAAVGAHTGTAELQVSSHSNLVRVRSERTARDRRDVDETETVDVWSLDGYLEAHELDPGSVHVVRMDVEGYEVEVLRGMASVLRAGSPLLLFLEVHPTILDDAELAAVVGTLERHGLEISAVVREGITVKPFVRRERVGGYADLLDRERPFNLLVRRAGRTARDRRPLDRTSRSRTADRVDENASDEAVVPTEVAREVRS